MENVLRTPVKLTDLVQEFKMEVINEGENFSSEVITISELNRPAFQLMGHYDYFDAHRLQILGNAEMFFIESLSEEKRLHVMNMLMSFSFPAMIIARNGEISKEILSTAQRHGRTLLRTEMTTALATSAIIDYLNRGLAPQVTRHGVLMNIYGQGVLILGDSGVGKSETAIELLKRGHQLVADDAVEIKRIGKELYGSAPELIRHYIEIRGVGVINVKQLFGMGAVQFETQIDLIINLEQWVEGKFYDRLGLGGDTYRIMDIDLPIITIPVRPGRTLASIVEIAVMKNRQTMYGGNPSEDFVSELDRKIDQMAAKNNKS